MSTDLETLENQFKWNNGIYERTVRDIPAEQWLIQPGENSNHLLWVVGHTAVTRAVALRLVGGEWSAGWQNMFTRGQERRETSPYPPVSEIRQAWSDVSDRLLEALPNASLESMGRPADTGKPSIDGTVAGTVGFLCLHESYHLGQMGFIRKWLGHGQAVG